MKKEIEVTKLLISLIEGNSETIVTTLYLLKITRLIKSDKID